MTSFQHTITRAATIALLSATINVSAQVSDKPDHAKPETRDSDGSSKQDGMGVRKQIMSLARALDLTHAQKKALKIEMKALRAKNDGLYGRLNEARAELNKAAESGNKTAIDKAADRLAVVLADKAVARAGLLRAFDQILTDEQRAKMEQLKAERDVSYQ